LKSLFNIFEALELNGFDHAHEMPMMKAVRIAE